MLTGAGLVVNENGDASIAQLSVGAAFALLRMSAFA
jgi:hypothetical protein